MALIYPHMAAGAIDDPVFGHFDALPGGGFSLPEELADRLIAVHYRGKPMWESAVERDERLHGEESARRRDPESLYAVVSEIAEVSRQLAALQLGAGKEAGNGETAALREQVAELNGRLAAMEARASADADSGVSAGQPAPAKAVPARKSPAAK